MVEEVYCSYEVCKLLKEKGFDEPCFMSYHETNKGHEIGHDAGHTNTKFDEFFETSGVMSYSAPTQQMAMAWLRDVHNIHIEIRVQNNGTFVFYPYNINGCNICGWDRRHQHDTYEDAVEAALKYVLENLI